MTNKIQVPLNKLDRLIEYVAPVYFQKRYQSRLWMSAVAAYTGASKSRRQAQEWKTSSGDADADTVSDLPTLRERCRDLTRNSPIAAGIINTSVTNIVGTGLKLQARIDRDILKISDDAAAEWEANTEREYRLWAESVECDRARELKFYDYQDLVCRQQLENGESFVLFPRIQRLGSPYELKLQAVEADRVSNPDKKQNSDTLVEGIEKDKDGAPVAYHIARQHPGSSIYNSKLTGWDRIEAFGKKTGLPNVLHIKRILRPGQTRGVPFLAPVIECIKQITRYTEAEIMAAVISSFFTVFIKTNAGQPGIPPFDTTYFRDESGSTASDKDIKLGSGLIVGLGNNQEIQTANPARPNSNFEPFLIAIIEQIGAALEIPYEVLIKHFSSSFSASRAALLEAWRFFRGRRTWLISHFCQPVYEIFLWEAIAKGRIPAPGFFANEIIRKAYCGAVWQGDAPIYIDPAKDIAAARDRLSLGISTLDEETTLITGGDMEKNIPQLKREIELLNQAGVIHPAQRSGNNNINQTNTQDENDEDT